MSMHRMLIILLALALAACASTIPVSRDFDPTADFAHLRTFAWAPDAPPPSKDSVVDSDTLLHQRLHNSITSGLLFKGFRQATDADSPADFWVAYRVVMSRRQDVMLYNNYYGYGYYGAYGWGGFYGAFPMAGPWMGPEAIVRDYELRTLVLDILDPKTRKLLWRATAEDYSDNFANPQGKTRHIALTIQQMLQGFPPLPAGQ